MVGLRFGCHIIKTQILSGFGSEYFELGAICDINKERLAKRASEYGVKAYDDFDKLLADDEIHAIGLFTGPVGRGELILKSIRAGKDVMTTKPFELDPENAEKVLDEAKRLNRVVYLNSPCASYSDDLKKIKEWQERYALGRPLFARHEGWYKSLQRADGSWYDDPELCPVAPIFRLGIYGINDMLMIFGEPELVQVMESRLMTGRPTSDMAQMCIRFKDGSMGHLINSWCLQPAREVCSLTIYFENGTVYRNPPLYSAYPTIEVKMCVVPSKNVDGTPVETVTLKPHQLSNSYQWDRFYKAIKGQRPKDEIPSQVIINGIRIIQAMKRASKSKKTEYV